MPCSSGAGGVGSIPANSDAQSVPSFRRWRFEMKPSPFFCQVSTVIKAFERKVGLGGTWSNSSIAQNWVKNCITVETWKKAVRANDIDMLAMARSVPPVQTIHTVEEKLAIRPDMKYLIDWCMGWMKTYRAAGRNPQDSIFGKDEIRVDSPTR
jgi:hypothetical protein